MIKNRNRKRGRNDAEDLTGFSDDEAPARGAPGLYDKPEDSDEEQGGGWASDDEEGQGTDGTVRVGDDTAEVKLKGGKITSVEGEEEMDSDADDGEIPIVPFNLKTEMAEGTFTENGMYVDNKFVEVRDAWLEEVDADNKERKSKGEKRSEVKKVEIEDFEKEDDELDILSLKRDVLECLLPGESVQKALKRLRGAGKKPTEGGADLFNKLMEAANNLLQAGEFGIYTESHTTIHESVEQAEKDEAVGQWDLKWAAEGEVYGPYSTAQMVAWHKEGYFKPPSGRPGLVRQRDPRKATETITFKSTHGVNWEDEESKADMLADLLDDDDEV